MVYRKGIGAMDDYDLPHAMLISCKVKGFIIHPCVRVKWPWMIAHTAENFSVLLLNLNNKKQNDFLEGGIRHTRVNWEFI